MDKPIRILLVDDEPADRKLVKRTLSKENEALEIVEADSQCSFIDALDRGDYDIVITDFKLGDLDGLDVIREVRRRGSDTPIIMLTGTGTEEVAIEAMKCGVSDYVIKNIHHIKRLPATVEHVLRTAALERSKQKAELELRHAQKMEAVGMVAAGAAHSFNNTLTAILAYALGARRTLQDTDRVRQALDGIIRASKSANAVTDSLLKFSRKSVPLSAPVNLYKLVQETAGMLDAMVSSEVKCSVDLGKQEETWTLGDAAQLQQVILNLAINASHAIVGEGHIKIRLTGGEPMGDYVGIVVEDDGCGMSKEVRERVFEPFFTTKPTGQGTGLGMSIVERIVREYGGTIEVESAEGKGTRVTVQLPRCDPSGKRATAVGDARASD